MTAPAEFRRLSAARLRAWEKYFDARDSGLSVEAACRKAGKMVSPASGYRFERGDQSSSGLEAAARLGRNMVAGNLVSQALIPEAAKALEDFAFFRLRYFGRRSEPWQVRAAYEVLKAIGTNEREYIVINCPPGSGKSTLFTHDVICWLIARDRTLRIQIGSRTERQARMYVNRIKKSLERDAPMRADADSLAEGIQFDAVACLQDDYGAFRPEGRSELWRAEALTVRQLDGVSLDDKEPSVTAWGQDSGFLGGRFDVVIWDDLVDRKNTRTKEAKDQMREWWGTEAETRLEPKGVLILQGQRIAHDDLYRHCLDMQTMTSGPKYRHIVYQAHDDAHCKGHDNDDVQRPPSWPDGCLLDSRRLSFKMLQTIKHNNPRVFEVQYQQNDGDMAGGLIDPAWIKGGADAEGYLSPGCLDKERAAGMVPAHLTDGRGWSFVTVDPSPTEWWGIIWWIYDPTTQNRYAIDIIRRRLNPEQFLSVDLDTLEYSGLMEDLRRTATMAGAPIQICVFETNAAQRWLLQAPHIQRYMDITGLTFVPHGTYANKADPKFGLESIGDLFRQGKIRLPDATPTSRIKVADLVNEAIHYPDSDTTDMIMSTWFGKLAVENYYTPNTGYGYRLPTASWLRPAQRGLAGAGRGLWR